LPFTPSLLKIVAAHEPIIRERRTIRRECSLRDVAIDGADERGIRLVEVLAPGRLAVVRVVLVLLDVQQHCCFIQRRVQIVDGGETNVLHDIPVFATRPEIFRVELVEVGVGAPPGSVGLRSRKMFRPAPMAC
jgi:hypothetical protein